MNCLESENIRLRALEPEDVDVMYRWENDVSVWRVSNTTAPYSKYMLREFVENQRHDVFETKQLRLMICTRATGRPVGAVDLFDVDPYNRRAGVGILIYETQDKRHGYASEALALMILYAFQTLILNQLYCNITAGNIASMSLFRNKGFTMVGLKKEWIKTTADWQDEYMLQLINPKR
ncbi:MAG: GNAT family N-acetyltransferase [Rikenellaceae bacterium]|jgi:diamine N-acetyltransferase|nr:GNAT family N-acetyltransferase [Rikenellaceae bacterium]